MTEVQESNFWEKEDKLLWRLFEQLKQEVDRNKFPRFSLGEFESECNNLHKYFMSTAFPHQFTQEEMKRLESEARVLEYDPDKGVCAWFKRKKKEKKIKFHETRTHTSSERKNKKDAEIGCVKTFYKNKGLCLEDSQIKQDEPEDSPIDVTIVENSTRTHFQVTYLQGEEVGQLLKGDLLVCDMGDMLKTIGNKIEKVIVVKVHKTDPNIIPNITLLLDARIPLLVEELDYLEDVVAEVSVRFSFKEVYIVGPKRNISVKCS